MPKLKSNYWWKKSDYNFGWDPIEVPESDEYEVNKNNRFGEPNEILWKVPKYFFELKKYKFGVYKTGYDEMFGPTYLCERCDNFMVVSGQSCANFD